MSSTPYWPNTPYTRDSLPSANKFGLYTKRLPVRATRVTGPFSVLTREGTLNCPDGWLAIDSLGWPYPIAADEFERIYVASPAEPDGERGGSK